MLEAYEQSMQDLSLLISREAEFDIRIISYCLIYPIQLWEFQVKLYIYVLVIRSV